MFRVQSERWSGVVNIQFASLLLDWTSVPSRFFNMVSEALPSTFTEDPKNFSVTTGNTLDEVSAKYSILGGSDSIVLSAKMLSMEFRDLSSDMLERVIQIIHDVETSFVTRFPECSYGVLEVISLEHLSVCDDQLASDYLELYALPLIEEAFDGHDVVNNPSARFTVVDSKNTWSAHCIVEKSHLLDNGLFLNVRASLLQVSASDPFQEKRERINEIAIACMRALQLELNNG